MECEDVEGGYLAGNSRSPLPKDTHRVSLALHAHRWTQDQHGGCNYEAREISKGLFTYLPFLLAPNECVNFPQLVSLGKKLMERDLCSISLTGDR